MKRRAKIVATIGPASSSPEKLQQLVSQGMDVARLNFSHGDHAQHGQAIADIRHIAEKQEYAIAIMQDLQGPKVRTGHMAEGESVNLENGQELILTTQP
ncbi:MAG: pyruvate kinase, partial [Anaerolineales bacterium]